MSKIGKNAITIPQKTEVTVGGGNVSVKGPLGTLSKTMHSMVTIAVADGKVTVTPKNTSKLSRSLWGTFASHIKNMIAGVNKKYEKKLTLEGIGYRVELQGKNLKFLVGFSHPVLLAIPAGLDVAVEKNAMTVSGIDKEAVGQFAADIRAVKKPEPYKGKGIRYEGEYVRQKQGKKVAA
ncbi:50S ribosomal protein L6 [Candidatus Kaiserbacteria bacterium]|nr:50S ribosomal protein L6 [Candidatus Kaiserbacteria bacterium]